MHPSNGQRIKILPEILWQHVSNPRGFLLAEAMAAMVLIMVALFAVFGLFLQAYHANSTARDVTFAVNTAKWQLENMKYQIEDKIAPNNSTYREFSSYPVTMTESIEFHKKKFAIRVDAATQGNDARGDNDPNNLLIKVTVSVTWADTGVSQSVQLVTYCLRNNAFSVYPQNS